MQSSDLVIDFSTHVMLFRRRRLDELIKENGLFSQMRL